MSLLEDALSDSKFERNARIFKSILYASIFLALALIIYSIFNYKKTKKFQEYNDVVTKMIIQNKVDLTKLDSNSPVNNIAKFKYVTSKINQINEKIFNSTQGFKQDEFDKAKFKKEIIDNLESLAKPDSAKGTDLLCYAASNYLTMLILDHPEFFEPQYIKQYFSNLETELPNAYAASVALNTRPNNKLNILFKTIWLKQNGMTKELDDFVNEINGKYSLITHADDAKSVDKARQLDDHRNINPPDYHFINMINLINLLDKDSISGNKISKKSKY